MKNSYLVLGLMSGTSLDGVDLALCDFSLQEGAWKFICKKAATYPYTTGLAKKLQQATTLSAFQLLEVDVELGKYFGERINNFLADIKDKPDYIASHGHTIFHQPEKGLTLQIGNGWAMLQKTGIPVINDFRSKDVALGGQGAPLVPIGDQLLFAEFDYCLNLGGIANISFEKDSKRIAYDIGPCNMVLNHLANQYGVEYDNGGNAARSGKVIESLLELLDRWPFYEKDYPKSLGFEQVSSEIFPLIEQTAGKTEDLLATFVEHIAITIVNSFRKSAEHQKVLITGGGAHNKYLIERIAAYLPDNLALTIPTPELINFKEAIIFAFLGVLRLRNQPNCLSSVTGASSDNCGGVVYK